MRADTFAANRLQLVQLTSDARRAAPGSSPPSSTLMPPLARRVRRLRLRHLREGIEHGLLAPAAGAAPTTLHPPCGGVERAAARRCGWLGGVSNPITV